MTRPRLAPALAALLALSGPALAQPDARTLGLAGTILPGPAAASLNPAYAAYPAPAGGGGLPLPVGLIPLLAFPDRSPLYYLLDEPTFRAHFDLLAFTDQVTHLNDLILNPPSSPREIRVAIERDAQGNPGINFTDENGRPLDYSLRPDPQGAAVVASGGLETPFFTLPVSLGPVRFSVGAFLTAEGPRVDANAALAALQGLSPNTTYSASLNARASAGLTFDGRYAQALDVGALTGPAVKRAYLGARARAFYGLAFVDATATASETTDANANPTTPSAEFQAFYVYPGAGYGFGGSVDLGAAADLEPNLTVGLGVVGAFSASSWTGTLYTSPAGGTITTVPETRSAVGPSPYYTVNVAFRPLDGPLGGLLLAADLRGGRGSASLHAGLEGQFGPVTARAGLGYDDGLNLGAGASFALGPAGLDLALTSHTAPFTAHQDFGIAATLRFGF